MPPNSIVIIHYTAPPIIGGVEAVIEAHVKLFIQAGFLVKVIAGRGQSQAIKSPAQFFSIPQIDSQNPEIIKMNTALDQGQIPSEFNAIVENISTSLAPLLADVDHVIIHNIFTKHFNLALTVALHRLIDQGVIRHAIAWCHDFTWTSPHSRSKVYPDFPWDLLRTYREDVDYVVVSEQRQNTLAELFQCAPESIHVIYNGVDPQELLGFSDQSMALIERLNLLHSDLNLLMPVRITQAKNIETALQLLAALKSQNINPKLVLTGPPDPHDVQSMQYFRSLKDLRQQLGVEEDIHFIFESGQVPDQPNYIDIRTVGDLFRISDVMFMPSHREGFGMPVLEAGLAGSLVVSTEIPASVEIGLPDVLIFDSETDPSVLAEQIMNLVESNPISRFRRRMRKNFTWNAIFQRRIKPLLRYEKN
jgi:glycosyltransferase involved in cell wall biosynthesis